LKKSYIKTLFSPIYSTLSTFLDATHKSMAAERRRKSIKRCFVKLSFYRLKEEEFVRAQLLPIAGTYSQRQKLPGFIITIKIAVAWEIFPSTHFRIRDRVMRRIRIFVRSNEENLRSERTRKSLLSPTRELFTQIE
jgi:hypothetical protein